MQLFYSPDITGKFHDLSAEESKHCLRVLRLKIGDIVHLTDGMGKLLECRIIDENIKNCKLEIINSQDDFGKRDYSIHLAVAPTKNINRFEWFLEKATEMGIDRITPVICDHSERRNINRDRLNKVIIAAMKQSLKAYLPILDESIPFKSFIQQNLPGEKFIAYIDENQTIHLKESYSGSGQATIFIGPEGDFSREEFEAAKNAGFKPVSLGPARLRTETAALYSCFAVNFLHQNPVNKKITR
ncbi:MAG: 16S rRNA (uracil(1498)-N(3))-methyltransferase [Bacteroidales bacterium]|nr:16S rRNA (uracil(1498)-N(3))-methyltransferase [Bacteroidales bacterium]